MGKKYKYYKPNTEKTLGKMMKFSPLTNNRIAK